MARVSITQPDSGGKPAPPIEGELLRIEGSNALVVLDKDKRPESPFGSGDSSSIWVPLHSVEWIEDSAWLKRTLVPGSGG